MIYKSGIVGCYEAYDYVKAMISKMGKIKQFKSFFEDTDPYFEIVDGYKKYYNLILMDENDNEFWLDSNCGYGGTGPWFTEKILQLVGVRENYNIDKKKIINEKNLLINNDMNVLLVLSDFSNVEEKYNIILMLEAKFNNSALRFKTFQVLNTLGNMDCYNKDDNRFKKYFECYSYIDNSSGSYRINNVLFISKNLKNVSTNDLTSFLNTMITNICGDRVEKEFKIINEQVIESIED